MTPLPNAPPPPTYSLGCLPFVVVIGAIFMFTMNGQTAGLVYLIGIMALSAILLLIDS